MKMPQSEWSSLWSVVNDGLQRSDPWLWEADTQFPLRALIRGSTLDTPVEELRGRSVLVWTKDQLGAALALIELDGTARRLVLCPPDLAYEHVRSVIAAAQVDVLVTDQAEADAET